MAAEKRLDNKVKAVIEDAHGWCIKHWGGGRYGKSGVPDVLACVNGVFVAIEDKAPNGKPSMLQLKNLEWIDSSGGFGILLYPDQFGNFEKFIKIGLRYDLTEWQRAWYRENRDLQKKWKEKLKTS